VLELMHFADELIDTGQFKVGERDVGKKDLQKAGALIDNMSGEWDPEKYRDE
jgi:non-homologous end joining protein Ku